MEGYLGKKKKKLTGKSRWVRRYFQTIGNHLCYSEKKEPYKVIGSIPLVEVISSRTHPRDHLIFGLSLQDGRCYDLKAECEQDRDAWLQFILAFKSSPLEAIRTPISFPPSSLAVHLEDIPGRRGGQPLLPALESHQGVDTIAAPHKAGNQPRERVRDRIHKEVEALKKQDMEIRVRSISRSKIEEARKRNITYNTLDEVLQQVEEETRKEEERTTMEFKVERAKLTDQEAELKRKNEELLKMKEELKGMLEGCNEQPPAASEEGREDKQNQLPLPKPEQEQEEGMKKSIAVLEEKRRALEERLKLEEEERRKKEEELTMRKEAEERREREWEEWKQKERERVLELVERVRKEAQDQLKAKLAPYLPPSLVDGDNPRSSLLVAIRDSSSVKLNHVPQPPEARPRSHLDSRVRSSLLMALSSRRFFFLCEEEGEDESDDEDKGWEEEDGVGMKPSI